MSGHTPEQVIKRIAEVSEAIGFQAGVGGVETAGFIISTLAREPHLLARFMAEGAELILDETINPGSGCLTYFARDGKIRRPVDARMAREVAGLKRAAIAAATRGDA
jgi:hypothetical protein